MNPKTITLTILSLVLTSSASVLYAADKPTKPTVLVTHDRGVDFDWEAGYAEGLGKPVIYTCKKEIFEKDKPHFDTNHHLTVIWDKTNIQEAVELLKATIRATLPDEAKLSDD